MRLTSPSSEGPWEEERWQYVYQCQPLSFIFPQLLLSIMSRFVMVSSCTRVVLQEHRSMLPKCYPFSSVDKLRPQRLSCQRKNRNNPLSAFLTSGRWLIVFFLGRKVFFFKTWNIKDSVISPSVPEGVLLWHKSITAPSRIFQTPDKGKSIMLLVVHRIWLKGSCLVNRSLHG